MAGVAAAASGEVLRLVGCLSSSSSSSPAASSSSNGSSSRGGLGAGRHGGGGGGPGCRRKVKMGRLGSKMSSYRLFCVETCCASSPSSSRNAPIASSGSCGRERERVASILALPDRTRTEGSTLVAPLSTVATTTAREKKRTPGARRTVQTSVTTTIVQQETYVGTSIDSAVEEAMAIAGAAAKAARDAARDAAAYAEVQASTEDDSVQPFPSEKDLLLLERARLTEMARFGAVQAVSSSTETTESSDHRASNPWTEWGFSMAEVDSGLDLGGGVSTLERGLFDQPWTDEQEEEERTDNSSATGRRSAGVTVRSNRRRERILKRERALMRADVAAAAVSSSTASKARKSQQTYDASDPVRNYLRDIGKTKLLTAAEEVGLAEGIQDLLRLEAVKADLIEQMGREPSVMEWAKAVGAEHSTMESRIKSGQASKDKMVNSNLRLVVSIAKRYQGRGMTIQDLIQEGSMGLIRGAEKFDHTRGFKFSTYAHWWIRQAITRAIADQSRTVRLPVHVYELLSRITKAKSMLAAEHGRAARDEEVAELVGLNIDKLKLVIKSAKTPKSMEFPIGRNNDTMLGEVIPDKDFESPEEAITKRLLKQDLETVLNTLSPRERDVLRLRYGLDDGRMRTLEEIGNVFSVTRERIRQIEAKALRKLRQPSRNTALREYLDRRA